MRGTPIGDAARAPGHGRLTPVDASLDAVERPRGTPRRRGEATMQAWEYGDVLTDQAGAGRLYHEFLRVPDLSAGLYVLEAGGTDPQSPHTEDELYYVVTGRAMVTVAGETRPVVPGTLV